MKLVPVLILAALLGGCKRNEPVGPAQKAGAAIDNAGEKVVDSLQAPLRKADEAAKQVADAARDTGEKIKDATEDASRGLDKATEKVGEKVEHVGEKIQETARAR